jgi:hypothetical protein
MNLLVQLLVYVGIVLLAHHIYQYVQSAFTTPKRVNRHQLHEKKYQEILDELQQLKQVAPVPGPGPPVPGPDPNQGLDPEQKHYLKQALMEAF